MAQFRTPSGALVDQDTGRVIQAAPGQTFQDYQMFERTPTASGRTVQDYYMIDRIPTASGQTLADYTMQPITSDSLAAGESLTLPDTPKEPDYLSSLNSIISSFGASPETGSALERESDDFSKQITDLGSQLLGESSAQLREEEERGIPQLRKQLTEFGSQIQTLQKEASLIPIQIQKEFEGRGVTAGGVAPIQSGRLRENAIKALSISALAQTVQGNLSLAQQEANRAVDLEFEPLKNKLDVLKTAYAMNKDKLERFDKKRADALNIVLNERTRILNDAKAEKNAAMGLINAAISNYAGDPGAQMAAQKVSELDPFSPNYMSKVYSLIGQYQRDPVALQNALLQQEKLRIDVENAPLERQKALADIEYTRAQIAKIYTDINNIVSHDPSELLAYAQEYAANGKIPSGLPKGIFGQVAELAKIIPKQKGEIVSSATGVKSSAVSDALQGAYGALYSVVDLTKQLKELDKQRWGGVISGTFGKIVGDKSQQQYVDTRTQIVDLIARARTGAALTAQEEAFYLGLLPGRLDEPFGIGADSQVRIDNLIKSLQSDLSNKLASQGLVMHGISQVEIGGNKYKVGEIITYEGKPALVLPDGSLNVIE